MVVNAFLIIVAAVIIVCILIGAKKGFVQTVFTMFSLFIIVILTAVLSPYVSGYITEHTQIPSNIKTKIEKKIDLEGKIRESEESLTISTTENVIDLIDIPEQLKDLVKEKGKEAGKLLASDTKDPKKTEIVNNIYDWITELIVDAIAYLFTFAVLLVVFLVAGLLLDIISKLPVIRQANTILGAIMGFVQGYIIVSIMYIASLAFSSVSLGASVIEMVNESSLLTTFFDHNPIVDIVFGMLK